MPHPNASFYAEISGTVLAIALGIWRFIKWIFGFNGRLEFLENSRNDDKKLHTEIKETMATLSSTMVESGLDIKELKTVVNLLVENKIK